MKMLTKMTRNSKRKWNQCESHIVAFNVTPPIHCQYVEFLVVRGCEIPVSASACMLMIVFTPFWLKFVCIASAALHFETLLTASIVGEIMDGCVLP